MITFKALHKTSRRFTPTLFLILIVLTVGATPAFAETETLRPWWHLNSASRPTYLQVGQGKGEVLQLTVSATAGEYYYEERNETAPFRPELIREIKLVGGESPTEVEKALEQIYGVGNVEVTGSLERDNDVYDIKFTGELAAEPEGVEVGPSRLASIKQPLSNGGPEAEMVMTAVNLGDAEASTQKGPITISDKLPPGLTAVGIEGYVDEQVGAGEHAVPMECSVESLSCTFTGKYKFRNENLATGVPPYGQIQMRIWISVQPGAHSGEINEATVLGGGALPVTVKRPITVSGSPVPFGVSEYELRPEDEGGGADTQAGSHPFQLTTTLGLNETFEDRSISGILLGGEPAALTKDLHFKVPPGLIGNPTPFPQCSLGHFLENKCAEGTVVGVARVEVNLPVVETDAEFPFLAPLYNLEPAVGEPARFGFLVHREVPVLLNTSVRTGGDYGVTVSVTNITQAAEFLFNEVTFWGVPGDSRHNSARGEKCLDYGFAKATGSVEGNCPSFEEVHPPPLLSLPTSCTGALHTTVEADSWNEPKNVLSFGDTEPMPALDGCNRLPFVPEIKVSPDSQQASKPTGLTVDVHVPQEGQLNGEGISQSNVKNIQVALPEGVILNPSAADGLEGCSEHLIGFGVQEEGKLTGFTEYEPGTRTPRFTPYLPGSTAAEAAGDTERLQPGVNFCPNAAKIATATIRTPLLPNPLEGFVYLASPQNFSVFPPENPFETHVAMYIVAEDPVSGSLVKLPGKVSLNKATGQITATFEDNPQLPFEDAELHFFGGERAPLASPSRCGTYTTDATYTPWSGGEPIHSSSSFEITSGPNGTPCPGASLPFNATLSSGTTNNNTGSFTPLTTTLSRTDGQQAIQSVTLHYPPGVSGLLSGVKLCPEAQANEGTCGPESQIGETIVSVGVGGDPFTVTGGKVYITEKYDGAPFGLSIVNPAKAGPFDLQEGRPVVVRAKIEVNPITAALTITTDPAGSPHAIPTIIEGFPLQIQHVNVLVNRPGFTFNPTNCTPTQITGVINSAEGASSPVSVPFQVTNCGSLKFAPKFAVSTAAKTSKANGASLTVKLSYPNSAEGAFDGPEGAYTNIARVKVELPKLLPSRLTTLQKACSNAQFEANPAGCPAASIVGHAKAITPLIPVPLEGPAYFVSHGGEAFPSLVIVLQGYGVTVDLVGTTFINKAGVTSSTFKTVPDAPVGTFELTLPQGQFSALAANGNLCKEKLAMPTEFVAQNGAEIHESTKIEVTGCPKAKKAKHKKTSHRKKHAKKAKKRR